MTDDVDETGEEERAPVGGYLTLPFRAAHELAHLAAALPWVESWEIRVSDAKADVEVVWRRTPPRLLYALIFLAPTVFGLVTVAIVAWSLVERGGSPLPETQLEAVRAAVLVLGWILFTTPSRGDLAGARDALRGRDGR